jgi:hypothetical protein
MSYYHSINFLTTSGLYAVISYNVPVPRSSFVILNPMYVKTWVETTTGSGQPMARQFCGQCGSPIVALPESDPGVAYVKLAIFGNNVPVGLELNTRFAKGKSIIVGCGSCKHAGELKWFSCRLEWEKPLMD